MTCILKWTTTLVKLAIEKFHRFNHNGALHKMTACQCRKNAKGNQLDHWLNDMHVWNTAHRELLLFYLNLKRPSSQFLMVHFEKPRHSFKPKKKRNKADNITSRKLFIRLVVFDQMKRLCWIWPCPWNYLQFAVYWLIHFILSCWIFYKNFLFEEGNVFSNWKRNKQTNTNKNIYLQKTRLTFVSSKTFSWPCSGVNTWSYWKSFGPRLVSTIRVYSSGDLITE